MVKSKLYRCCSHPLYTITSLYALILYTQLQAYTLSSFIHNYKLIRSHPLYTVTSLYALILYTQLQAYTLSSFIHSYKLIRSHPLYTVTSLYALILYTQLQAYTLSSFIHSYKLIRSHPLYTVTSLYHPEDDCIWKHSRNRKNWSRRAFSSISFTIISTLSVKSIC